MEMNHVKQMTYLAVPNDVTPFGGKLPFCTWEILVYAHIFFDALHYEVADMKG
jgi:hypothetical protein